MYSQDKIDIALQVYHQCGSVTETIRILGTEKKRIEGSVSERFCDIILGTGMRRSLHQSPGASSLLLGILSRKPWRKTYRKMCRL